jgi:hypothetical protein
VILLAKNATLEVATGVCWDGQDVRRFVIQGHGACSCRCCHHDRIFRNLYTRSPSLSSNGVTRSQARSKKREEATPLER